MRESLYKQIGKARWRDIFGTWMLLLIFSIPVFWLITHWYPDYFSIDLGVHPTFSKIILTAFGILIGTVFAWVVAFVVNRLSKKERYS